MYDGCSWLLILPVDVYETATFYRSRTKMSSATWSRRMRIVCKPLSQIFYFLQVVSCAEGLALV